MKNKLIVFALVTILCFSCSEEKKTIPKMQLKIAYNVLHEEEIDNYEIFVMNIDGTDKQNISNRKGVDWVYYSWKGKLYFLSDRDTTHRAYVLYEMDANGKNIRKIYSEKLYDSWITGRNNGSEFIVTTNKDNIKSFVLIDKEGNELKTIFGTNEYNFNDPCFSPDGKEIVFRCSKSGVDELWIMDENGEHLRQLTYYPKGNSTSNQHFYHAGPPSWGRNQNVISYMSWRRENYNIYTIKPNGSELKALTKDGFDEGWHSWSPDGKKIVYDGTPLDKPNYDIYVMDADGSNVTQLTSDSIYEQAPLFVEVLEVVN